MTRVSNMTLPHICNLEKCRHYSKENSKSSYIANFKEKATRESTPGGCMFWFANTPINKNSAFALEAANL